MSPAWIRPRDVKKTDRNPRGRTYQVLYRRGGRGYRIETAGTFKTERDARTRRDLIAGWLAAGLDPKTELATLATPPERKTPERWLADWLASLHQLDEHSRRTYQYGAKAAISRLTVTDLAQVTVPDCERILGELVAKYAVATVANYWQAFAQLLDYAQVDPNPARDRRIRLPKLRRAPVHPPTAEHLAAMLSRMNGRHVLPAVFIEQTAVRVETIETLCWGSVDVAGDRFRTIEKGDKPRWGVMPRWLTRLLEQTCPVEDRLTDRRVFPGTNAKALRYAMATACKNAGIPHYHPHDLRHRRASLWHLQGVPDAVLAERIGHDRSSFTKDVYVHVMPVGEVPGERLEALVVEALA